MGESFGLMTEEPRQGGLGPRSIGEWSSTGAYEHPAAGWGAAATVGKVLLEQRQPIAGTRAMFTMNHPKSGFDCPGCAWPDDKGVALDICENGIKHVTWEMTAKRVGKEFFAEHSVTELSQWNDFDLEDAGRLVGPMVYDAASDHYVPISWNDAFRLIGEQLTALDSPDNAAFYTSGRLSNEASFLYQLFARELGTNNLPDCSNMCHEGSGRGLTASLATPKGTADLEDWETCDALFVLGVNAASNAPRMLTSLSEAVQRGAQVVHVNTLREVASTRTIVPHEILDMATFNDHPTGTRDLQVRPGGDLALVRGMAKVVFEAAETDPTAIDHAFLAEYTNGLDEYRALVEATGWDELVEQSGLTETEIRDAAAIYLAAERTVISWCLGVSQHRHGVDTVREIVNLLLLRGNVGRKGTGPSPVRGHSNVQGNRTCGINHKPAEKLLAKLDEVCGITSPRTPGLDTVHTVAALHRGDVKVFIGMGGNFVRAAPDPAFTAEGMNRCELTVHVSTKLNRSHLTHGKQALILPCLGRTERDVQEAGPQSISTEDAMSAVMLSLGSRKPASPHLLSEPEIIARIARATMPESATPWEWYVGDYDRIRDVMAKVLPGFEGFNELVRQHYGFRIPQPARERDFQTPSGKAEFSLAEMPNVIPEEADVLVLQTMRSHDQWNTTIYSSDDRYRGVRNIRELVFMHRGDMKQRGIAEGDLVDIVATSNDGSVRSVTAYRALQYDTPRGSAAGYFPEMNVLLGPDDYSRQSDQPLAKDIRVRISKTVAR